MQGYHLEIIHGRLATDPYTFTILEHVRISRHFHVIIKFVVHAAKNAVRQGA
jgi:hypothetical protein